MPIRDEDLVPGKQPGVADYSNTERNQQLDNEFGNPGYQGDSTSGEQDQRDRDKALGSAKDGFSGDYSMDGAEKRQLYDEWANLHGKEGRSDPGHNYYGPGAADYGGRGGVEEYRQRGIAGGQRNDAEQQRNSGALAGSLTNMQGDRGQVYTEDKTLAGRAASTRDQQMSALELSRGAAMGQAPSEAAFQTRLGMNDVMATQAGAMGGARGLAGLSGAQTQGGANASASAGNLGMAGGLARSKEIADAIGMYGTQAGTVREQDLDRLKQNSQNSQFNANLNDQWKLGNAQLAANQGRLGVSQGQTDLGWMGEQTKGADKQFQYDQEMAATAAGQDADQMGARLAANRESREHTRGLVNGAVTAGLTGVGAAFGGPIGGAAGAAAGQAFGAATSDWDW